MKRILAIVFVLQMLLSSVCMAFEPPTDERWKALGEVGKFETWLDIDTIKYYFQNDVVYHTHKGHKCVEIWLMEREKNSKCYNLIQEVYDISCNSRAVKKIIYYGENGSIDDSREYNYLNFSEVVPNSIGEVYNKMCKYLWENDLRNELK